MRKNIVAGNWKMNCDLSETENILRAIKNQLKPEHKDVEIMVAPAFTNLFPAVNALKDTQVKVAAQNLHQEENGAFTGEVSPQMIKSLGVETVILGHSERRQKFGEDLDVLKEKVDAALKNDFTIIFCIGESLEDRENDNHFSVVEKQLNKSLFQVKQEDWSNIILAYEPVWAIGTGKTASAEQAQEMHAHIRKVIADQYDEHTANGISILYGGSVKPHNAGEIFAKEDVDGGLIGGASLKAEDFFGIINAF